MKKIYMLAVVFALFAWSCNENTDLTPNADDVQLKGAITNNGYTEQFYFYPMGEAEYACPVICDGELVDYLVGDGAGVEAHVIIHSQNGEGKWGKWLVKGSLTSERTGETFKIHEANKGQFDNNGRYYLTFHTNAIGDMGTHYIFSGILLWPEEGGVGDGEFIVEKAICVPVGK